MEKNIYCVHRIYFFFPSRKQYTYKCYRGYHLSYTLVTESQPVKKRLRLYTFKQDHILPRLAFFGQFDQEVRMANIVLISQIVFRIYKNIYLLMNS